VRRVALHQADDAPELALAHPALDGEQPVAQPGRVFAHLAGLAQDVAGLA
jgi:hypothetical protein